MPIAARLLRVPARARANSLRPQARANLSALRSRLAQTQNRDRLGRFASGRKRAITVGGKRPRAGGATTRGEDRQPRTGYPLLAVRAMVNGLKSTVPVKTGALKRSLAARKRDGAWRPTARRVYADVVNRRGRSKGWVGRGLRAAAPAIRRELRRANASHLPVPRTMRSIRRGYFTPQIESAVQSWMPRK